MNLIVILQFGAKQTAFKLGNKKCERRKKISVHLFLMVQCLFAKNVLAFAAEKNRHATLARISTQKGHKVSKIW